MGWQLRLADRYRLVERLGDRDGVEVWHALDETLSRPVRIEVVTAAVVPAKTDRERLAAAVRRAARVRHPAIATIYDCDVTRDGQGSLAVYAVSEFVEGVGLADGAALDALPIAGALDVLCQIASALAAAHRMGVVHGGLGPTEVVLTPHGVKISGFGIRDLPHGRSGPAAPGGTGGTGVAVLHAGAADDVAALGVMISDRLIDRPLPEDVRNRLVLLRRWCAATDPGARPTAAHALEALTALRKMTVERSSPAPIPPADPGPHHQLPPPRPSGPGVHEATQILNLGDDPGGPEFPPPPSAVRSRTTRRLLTGACLLGAATLAALIFVANQPRPAQQTGAQGSPPASGGAAPQQGQGQGQAATPSTLPQTEAPIANVSPAAALATLNRLRQAVNRSDLAGKIRQDVALDLRNVIGNLENDLTSGHAVDVRQRLTDIEQKISTRLREGGLDTQTAANLTKIITAKRS